MIKNECELCHGLGWIQQCNGGPQECPCPAPERPTPAGMRFCAMLLREYAKPGTNAMDEITRKSVNRTAGLLIALAARGRK